MELWLLELMSLQHFHFLRPLWLLISIPFMLVLFSFKQKENNLKNWQSRMSKQILQKLLIKGSNKRFITPIKLILVISILITLVLSGPTWQQQPSPFTENKSNLIIALDVSQSMDQSDIQPSRLLRAKQKIIELLNLRGDANTALIAFSGSAHTVMPITNDNNMITHFLNVLESNLMPKSGKSVHAILPVIDKLLENTTGPSTVLLVGDGVNDISIGKFGSYFNQTEHKLVVLAMGNEHTSGTNIIPMQLNMLSKLITLTHGHLVQMTNDKEDIEKVNRFISYNQVITEDDSTPWHDSGYPLVWVIACLFLFWFRTGWTLQW